MKLPAAIFAGALMCTAPIHAGRAFGDGVRWVADNPECFSGVRLGQASPLSLLARSTSARVEEYLQFHAEAVQSSEPGVLPWPALRVRSD
jgi:hypothetical protein